MQHCNTIIAKTSHTERSSKPKKHTHAHAHTHTPKLPPHNTRAPILIGQDPIQKKEQNSITGIHFINNINTLGFYIWQTRTPCQLTMIVYCGISRYTSNAGAYRLQLTTTRSRKNGRSGYTHFQLCSSLQVEEIVHNVRKRRKEKHHPPLRPSTIVGTLIFSQLQLLVQNVQLSIHPSRYR